MDGALPGRLGHYGAPSCRTAVRRSQPVERPRVLLRRHADELTAALSRVPGLRLAARTSAFQFRGGAHDVLARAAELDPLSVTTPAALVHRLGL